MQPAGNQPKRTDPAPQPSFITKCIATVFYSGYAPIAPGTAGSLVALLPLIIFPTISTSTLLVIVIIGFFIGVGVSRQFERAYGEDPQVVVIDEAVGMWITMLFVPVTWKTLALGFILFRIFDIIKPPPARQFEAVPNGWGIMLDDVAAGIYAALLLFLITTF
jgi:phosphatidylglycerophosphatase A